MAISELAAVGLVYLPVGGVQMKYDRTQAGEWVQPVRQGYKMCCCDCGLVHTMNFRLYRRRIQFQVFRNNRATAMVRRWQKEI